MIFPNPDARLDDLVCFLFGHTKQIRGQARYLCLVNIMNIDAYLLKQ